jgi:hypothetical protein
LILDSLILDRLILESLILDRLILESLIFDRLILECLTLESLILIGGNNVYFTRKSVTLLQHLSLRYKFVFKSFKRLPFKNLLN